MTVFVQSTGRPDTCGGHDPGVRPVLIPVAPTRSWEGSGADRRLIVTPQVYSAPACVTGDFTAPGTFNTYAALAASPRLTGRLRPFKIETYTRGGAICCKDPSERCPMFFAPMGVHWPTQEGHGCTLRGPICRD